MALNRPISTDKPRLYFPQARAILQVIFDGFAGPDDDVEPKIIPVLPKEVTIHKNSYKQADSWKLTFDANDMPIDPRLIRAGAVEIYLFQSDGISADNQLINRQITFQDPEIRTPLDLLMVSIGAGDEVAKQQFAVAKRPVIAGLFDETGLSMSSSGKWVTLEGQDYTAHLASMQWPPDENGHAVRIPTGKRLDTQLSEILSEADPNGHLTLVLRNIEEGSLPIVGTNETIAHGRGIPIEQGTTYWDVMYKLASRYGLILYVDGLDVVLSRPKNIVTGDERIRRLRWGANLESLEMKRHLGKEQVPTIIVVGYDAKSLKRFEVMHPSGTRELTQTTVKLGKGKHAKLKVKTNRTEKEHISKKGKVTTTVRNRDEYQYVPAYGITDLVVLKSMAENLHNLLGRAERKIVAKTKDLKDLYDDDLLNLTSGDAVAIDWDEFNNEILLDKNVSQSAKIYHLEARGFGQAIARIIAESYDKLASLGASRPLRVREVTYEFSADGGISVEMELVDFIILGGERPPAAHTPRSEKLPVLSTKGKVVGDPLRKARHHH